jgi:fluoride exporter
MIKYLNLMIGGTAGTFARYFLSAGVYRILGSDFPYGTMIVNLLGCLIIGFLAVLAEEKFVLSPDVRILLMIGFCGAFTTFSTFILESANLIKYGEVLKAFINIGLSVILGFVAFWAGIVIARNI